MSALLIAPQASDLASYLVNRFYPQGKLYVVSSEPMISSSVASYARWVRLPRYNSLGINPEELSASTNAALEKIVKKEHDLGEKITRVFLFPNLSYNNNFLTVTFDSLLESVAENMVIPVSILSGLFEYGTCSPFVKITIFLEKSAPFESEICAFALRSALERFKKVDVTGYSSAAQIELVSVGKEIDKDALDSYCELTLAKEI